MLMLPYSQKFTRTFIGSAIFRAGTVAAILALSACASKNPLLDNSVAKAPAAPAAASATNASTNTSTNAPVSNPDLSTKTTELTSSQKFLWFFSPYRVTIQQGNFISQEMIAQVKTGMTKDQARFILGTPLLTDVFHGERWDYPFRLQKGSGETTTSRIALFFKDDKIERIESGVLPTESEYLTRIAGPAPSGK
jgi:outer membrane protein assembly factor BamE